MVGLVHADKSGWDDMEATSAIHGKTIETARADECTYNFPIECCHNLDLG